MELDRKDLQMLSLLQQSNLMPHREIAERINLSTPAVTRRLQRLRADGVICKDVSILDAHKLGRPLTIIAEVVADNEKVELLDKMRGSFAKCAQVQHCYYVTGQADFILIFNVSDMAEYEGLTRTLFFDSGNVKRFTTHVSMETIKAGNEIKLA